MNFVVLRQAPELLFSWFVLHPSPLTPACEFASSRKPVKSIKSTVTVPPWMRRCTLAGGGEENVCRGEELRLFHVSKSVFLHVRRNFVKKIP